MNRKIPKSNQTFDTTTNPEEIPNLEFHYGDNHSNLKQAIEIYTTYKYEKERQKQKHIYKLLKKLPEIDKEREKEKYYKLKEIINFYIKPFQFTKIMKEKDPSKILSKTTLLKPKTEGLDAQNLRKLRSDSKQRNNIDSYDHSFEEQSAFSDSIDIPFSFISNFERIGYNLTKTDIVTNDISKITNENFLGNWTSREYLFNDWVKPVKKKRRNSSMVTSVMSRNISMFFNEHSTKKKTKNYNLGSKTGTNLGDLDSCRYIKPVWSASKHNLSSLGSMRSIGSRRNLSDRSLRGSEDFREESNSEIISRFMMTQLNTTPFQENKKGKLIEEMVMRPKRFVPYKSLQTIQNLAFDNRQKDLKKEKKEEDFLMTVNNFNMTTEGALLKAKKEDEGEMVQVSDDDFELDERVYMFPGDIKDQPLIEYEKKDSSNVKLNQKGVKYYSENDPKNFKLVSF